MNKKIMIYKEHNFYPNELILCKVRIDDDEKILPVLLANDHTICHLKTAIDEYYGYQPYIEILEIYDPLYDVPSGAMTEITVCDLCNSDINANGCSPAKTCSSCGKLVCRTCYKQIAITEQNVMICTECIKTKLTGV